jgi:hypothetical protein
MGGELGWFGGSGVGAFCVSRFAFPVPRLAFHVLRFAFLVSHFAFLRCALRASRLALVFVLMCARCCAFGVYIVCVISTPVVGVVRFV